MLYLYYHFYFVLRHKPTSLSSHAHFSLAVPVSLGCIDLCGGSVVAEPLRWNAEGLSNLASLKHLNDIITNK